MDPVGLPIQSSLAGVKQQERAQTSERAVRDRDKTRFKRALDEAEFGDGLTPTEEVEATRKAKGGAQEESHEDRQQQGLIEGEVILPRIDLEG